MRGSIKFGKLIAIEDINKVGEGESIRIVGILLKRNENDDIALVGLLEHQQIVNLNDCLANIKFGHPYLIIGELRNNIVNARICRELTFSKYSLDYYLKTLSSCLYST